MMQQFKTLHKNMRMLRMVNRLSQEALADEIHLTRSTYSTYETGVKIPDLQTIDALASLYNIGFDCLVNQDISEGILYQLYFEDQDEELIDLMTRYQNLSIASKNLIMAHMDILLDRESVFYNELLQDRALIKGE